MVIERMLRAARLNGAVYRELASDVTATRAAIGIAVLAGLSDGVGQAASALLGPEGAANPMHAVASFAVGLVGTVGVYLVWSAVTYLMASRLFGSKVSFGGMLRVAGFAHAPGILAALAIAPEIGMYIGMTLLAWIIVASIVGLKQVVDISLVKVVGTVAPGMVASAIVAMIPPVLLMFV